MFQAGDYGIQVPVISLLKQYLLAPLMMHGLPDMNVKVLYHSTVLEYATDSPAIAANSVVKAVCTSITERRSRNISFLFLFKQAVQDRHWVMPLGVALAALLSCKCMVVKLLLLWLLTSMGTGVQ